MEGVKDWVENQEFVFWHGKFEIPYRQPSRISEGDCIYVSGCGDRVLD